MISHLLGQGRDEVEDRSATGEVVLGASPCCAAFQSVVSTRAQPRRCPMSCNVAKLIRGPWKWHIDCGSGNSYRKPHQEVSKKDQPRVTDTFVSGVAPNIPPVQRINFLRITIGPGPRSPPSGRRPVRAHPGATASIHAEDWKRDGDARMVAEVSD
jgi:hypothetical protein